LRLDEIKNQFNNTYESSTLKAIRELALSSSFSVQNYTTTSYLESQISETLKILGDSQAKISEYMNISKIYTHEHFGMSAVANFNKNENLLNSAKKFHEQLELVSNPFKNIHKEMEYLYEPMRKMNEDMEKILNPFSGIQKQMDSIFAPLENSLSDAFQSIMQTTNTYQKFMDSVLDTNKTSFELGTAHLNTALESYSSIEKMFKQIHSPSSVEMNIQNLVQEIIGRTKSADILDLQKAFETEIITNDETTYLKELEYVREELIENVQLMLDSKISEAVENLKLFIASQNNPYVTYLLQIIILPLIVSLIGTYIINPKMNEILSSYQHQHIVKKEIVGGIKKYIQDSKQLTQFRIVSCDVLNVRQEKSTKSKIISHLSFGEVVEIIQKDKNWCLVRKYDSKNETMIQGWVFTRYLSRIK